MLYDMLADTKHPKEKAKKREKSVSVAMQAQKDSTWRLNIVSYLHTNIKIMTVWEHAFHYMWLDKATKASDFEEV